MRGREVERVARLAVVAKQSYIVVIVFFYVAFVCSLAWWFHPLERNHQNKLAERNRIAVRTEILMPWETGLWAPVVRGGEARLPPSFKQVAAYAKAVVWAAGPDAMWPKRREAWRRRIAPASASRQPRRLLHVVNPFASSKARVVETQAMVMASIEAARAWIDYMDPIGIYVDVLVIEAGDEAETLVLQRPATFLQAKSRLGRTAMDFFALMNLTIGEKSASLTQHQKLPLLRDILLAGLSEAKNGSSPAYDHLIFSNMDINVMPHFYSIVDKLLGCHKSFFINRVEIPEYGLAFPAVFHLGKGQPNYSLPVTLQSMELGYDLAQQFQQNHPGYDCFVAPVYTVQRIAEKVGSVFTGFPPCGSVLAEAAHLADRTCVTARKMPATFHVGSRNGEWGNQVMSQLNGALARQLRPKKTPKCRPIAVRGRGFTQSKCYPTHVYPIPPGRHLGLWPQDWAILQDALLRSKSRSKNETTSTND